jgi:hypothetical protein
MKPQISQIAQISREKGPIATEGTRLLRSGQARRTSIGQVRKVLAA